MEADEDILKTLYADIIDGHAPAVTCNNLCAYNLVGLRQTTNAQQLKKLLKKLVWACMFLSVKVQALEILNNLPSDKQGYLCRDLYFVLTKTFDDILSQGTMSYCINKAIEMGLDP